MQPALGNAGDAREDVGEPGRPVLDADKLAFALKLVEAGVRPAQAARQLGLGLGRSTLYRELALIKGTAPDTPALEKAT